jgi:hypothetical protein
MSGEIDEKPHRSWQSKDDDSQMRCYLGMEGRVTLGELVRHFAERYPHVDPMSLELNYSTAAWSEPPTADEIANREKNRAWHAERLASWERETYDRLRAKFAT